METALISFGSIKNNGMMESMTSVGVTTLPNVKVA
jgi:hypothetical protein